ncbi:cysteine hydrolase family protein [Cohnella sp. AR92]|uniref:cysteine hydrolase family protein n=1 Tax=Cohnella sp. AR92 TaxID=648716 RepID=UPI000F8D9D7F|nr:isochorismatase family cysteine hydrolase [Cohnella sp. AR92]RUS47080.1 cysteine hydrolase [Cohnella sp. AR92]
MEKAAIIVIDMQYDFVGEEAVIPCKSDPSLIENNKKLLAYARTNGIPVIYTQEIHRKNHVDFGRELDRSEPIHCVEGTRGVEILEELKPEPTDYVIQKRRYSAFFQTDLQVLLKGLGVNTIILTGAATDVCVRATATDAQQHDFYVIVPKECVAGTSQKQHEAALEHIDYVLGRVVGMDELMVG